MDHPPNQVDPPFLPRLYRSLSTQFQLLLDKSTPHTAPRWLGLALLFLLYGIRVYYLQGFYIVTYGLGIFLLNLLIGFLSPLDDDILSAGEGGDGPLLPLNDSDSEFKPFMRRLPEFKFWSDAQQLTDASHATYTSHTTQHGRRTQTQQLTLLSASPLPSLPPVCGVVSGTRV